MTVQVANTYKASAFRNIHHNNSVILTVCQISPYLVVVNLFMFRLNVIRNMFLCVKHNNDQLIFSEIKYISTCLCGLISHMDFVLFYKIY